MSFNTFVPTCSLRSVGLISVLGDWGLCSGVLPADIMLLQKTRTQHDTCAQLRSAQNINVKVITISCSFTDTNAGGLEGKSIATIT